MPYGTSAPGKVLPPPVVHVRASTSWARSLTCWPTVDLFLAPAGSLPDATGFWQSVRRPSPVTWQVPLPESFLVVAVPSALALVLGLGVADALTLGVGDALGL